MSIHAILRGSFPSTLLALVLSVGGLLPSAAAADTTASELQFIVVSDDIQKKTTEVARPGSEGGSPAAPAPAPEPAAAPAGGSGHGNNGHGNNADGVDSSNPGQGQGGPNGGVDPSGGVDDEAGGGGASPSQNNGGGNANGNGGKKK